MWTSKLGNKYPMQQIQQEDQASQRELKRLRGLKCRFNDLCADCGRQDNSWSSVSLGVFICVTCSDVHRSVGTHITKVKGCTGTYLWGPDELDRMRAVGNDGAEKTYGSAKVSPTASKEVKQQFVIDKYEKRTLKGQSPSFVVPQKCESRTSSKTVSMERQLVPDVPVVRRATASESQQKAFPLKEAAKAGYAPQAVQAVPIMDLFFDDFFNELEDSQFQSKLHKNLVEMHPTEVLSSCHGSDLDGFLNSTLKVACAAPTQPTTKTHLTFDLEWPDC